MSSDFDEYAQMMDMNTRNLQKWIDMLCKKKRKYRINSLKELCAQMNVVIVSLWMTAKEFTSRMKTSDV